MPARSRTARLVVVANRLPVRRVKDGEGRSGWQTSPGGLVSALAPILRRNGGSWIGWAGYAGEAPEPFEHDGIRQQPVALSSSDVDLFYKGFSNTTLWPLYHDAVRRPEFHRHWWWPYRDVNRRFAERVAEHLGPRDTAWVHDYQLQLVPGMLRELRPRARIGYFSHVPFPPVELFAQLPWRRQILEGLLGADLVGFQTRDGALNFCRAARRFTDATAAKSPGQVLRYRGREVRAASFPISIDVQRFEALANDPAVQARAFRVREQLGSVRRVLLGVDRLDYTKGIDVRLRAFETLLANDPSAVDDLVLVQVAVPSRELVPDYAEMRNRIEQQVGNLNGTFGLPGRVPLVYLYRSLPVEELVAYYLAADVMCVTPLRDGMNLVAKEYVATRTQNTGALVLSEFTGSAIELKQALLVNPHDVDGVAAALERAASMTPREARRRMASMRRVVERADVHSWADGFLGALAS